MQDSAARVAPGDKLLKHPGFRDYWLARLLAQTAQGALLYGLLVLIVDRTERSIYGSLFVVCSIIPSLLFGLIGGWAADRLPQRLFMIVLNLVRAAIVATLLRQGADLPTIFAVTLGIWTVHQFFSPAESAVLARMVPVERLAAANSLSNLALTLAQVLGMVILAPLLLKLPDERYLFVAVSVLYAAAAVYLVRMGRLPGREPGQRRRPKLALRRGWRIAVNDPPSFGALLDAVLISVGMSTLVVIVPHFLVRVLNTDARNTVFVFAPAVIGLVLGLRLAPWLGSVIGHGRLATIGLVGFAAAIAGIGLVDQVVSFLQSTYIDLPRVEEALGLSTRTSATMLLSIPAGFCSALTNVAAKTVLLERAPEDARGQINATQSTLANAISLIPTLLAGLAIDLLDVRPVALVIAFLLVTGAVFGRRISSRAAVPGATDESGVMQPSVAPASRAR
jgi:MFS family permease